MRDVVSSTGYDDETKTGLHYQQMNVVCAISEQSHDLASAISMYYSPQDDHRDAMSLPAGETGTAHGYATDELSNLGLSEDLVATNTLMPASQLIAQALAKRLTKVQKSGEIAWLKPDGKVEVTLVYGMSEKGKKMCFPKRIARVAIHMPGWDADVGLDAMNAELKEKVVDVVLGKKGTFKPSNRRFL